MPMTINDLMGTECLDVDEILLTAEKKEKEKVVSMESFLKTMKGGN